MNSHKIYCGDCVDAMQKFDNDSIDLVVTSPPYDNLREYKGYNFDFESIANELFRVIRKGGVVVWVVGDATIDGSETGTSFKQALYFKDIGFRLHDTMIYEKNGTPFPEHTRYYNIFEYMFVLSKGKPKTINLLNDRKNKLPNGSWGNKTSYKKDGTKVKHPKFTSEMYGIRFNIWKYNVGFGFSSEDETKHPAIFPEKIANDHIRSWSNEGDLILDPLAGSGTTLIECERLNRNSIGIETSKEYCDLAYQRLSIEIAQTKLDRTQSTIEKIRF